MTFHKKITAVFGELWCSDECPEVRHPQEVLQTAKCSVLWYNTVKCDTILGLHCVIITSWHDGALPVILSGFNTLTVMSIMKVSDPHTSGLVPPQALIQAASNIRPAGTECASANVRKTTKWVTPILYKQGLSCSLLTCLRTETTQQDASVTYH